MGHTYCRQMSPVFGTAAPSSIDQLTRPGNALGRKASNEFAVPLCRVHHRKPATSELGGRRPASIQSRSPVTCGKTPLDDGRFEPNSTSQAAASDRGAEPGGTAAEIQTLRNSETMGRTWSRLFGLTFVSRLNVLTCPTYMMTMKKSHENCQRTSGQS